MDCRIVDNLRMSCDGTDEELRWLDDYTSVFLTKFRPGQWGPAKVEERHGAFNWKTKQLPTGFAKLLRAAAKRGALALNLTDLRKPPCAADLDADIGWLRAYQADAVMAVVRDKRGLIKVPTGGGKTEIFVGLTRMLPCEWLFVVHRADLVYAAADRYHLRTGLTAGTWDGKWVRGNGNVTVATFQGLYSAIQNEYPGINEFLRAMQAVNVDECHVAPATSYSTVLNKLENAYYRVGQSGTPYDRGELDSLQNLGHFGPIIYKIPTSLLIAEGVLSKPSIFMPPIIGKSNAATFAEVYSDLIVNNQARNEMLTRMAVIASKPALVFVEQMNHGHTLRKMMEQAGLSVSFVKGDDWVKKRQDEVKRLVKGKYDVLICSVIFQEGIDIPELRSVIVANGKASTVAALQRIGRGMRQDKSGTKHNFEVYDPFDQGQRWLQRHSKDRQAAYEKEGHVVTLAWPESKEE